MLAAVCRAFGAPLSLEEVELAPPGPGEIGVDVRACAICHSDIIYADGGWGGELPAVYGHEAAGVVTTVGAGVEHLAPGDHVVVTLIRACGHCPACAEGVPVSCAGRLPLDERSPLRLRGGEPLVQGLRTAAFAERVTVHASQAVRVPASLHFELAALLACGVITGFGAVTNTAALRTGSTAVVIGCGGVGMNAIQGAAIAGARTVIAVDTAEAKLAMAKRFGATHALQARDPAVLQEVRAITGGGADYVFVTVGLGAACTQGLAMLGRAGALVLVGMPPSGVTFEVDPGEVAAGNQRILGSKMGSARIAADIPRLVALHEAGRLQLEPLVSGRYKLDEINAALASSRGGEALRNVIVF